MSDDEIMGLANLVEEGACSLDLDAWELAQFHEWEAMVGGLDGYRADLLKTQVFSNSSNAGERCKPNEMPVAHSVSTMRTYPRGTIDAPMPIRWLAHSTIPSRVSPLAHAPLASPSLGEGISIRTARSLRARLQIHGTIFPNLRRPVKFKHTYFSTE